MELATGGAEDGDLDGAERVVLTDVKKPSLAGFQLARLSRRARARSGVGGFG
jgi:hypothetical protein